MKFGAMVLSVAVAVAVLLCVQQRPLSKNRSLRACDEVKFQGHDLCEAQKLLPAGNCFFREVQSQVNWMWMDMVGLVSLLQSFWVIVLVSSALMIPVAYIAYKMYKQFGTTEATYSVLQQVAGDQVGDASHVKIKVSILYMAALWLFDMTSDIYVVVVYLKQGMYVFGASLIGIWLLSGGLAFVHRYVSWQLNVNNPIDWAAGLNDRGEPRPGFRTAALYMLQVQPILMACDAWKNGRTTELDEEKVIAALCEGFPSSLLQLYALLILQPKGNPWILSASIAMSLYTLAGGVNKAFGLCQQGQTTVRGLLPNMGLIVFRFCDVFARMGVWALMGRCLRPAGAQVQGLQQPYLPVIMLVELLMTMIAFKVCLRLRVSELAEKYNFLGIICSFLGTFWCCYPMDLITQQRFSRSLVVARVVEAVAVLWSAAVLFFGSLGEQCILAENPVVVTLCFLTLLTCSFAFSLAMAHDVSLSYFAKPWFPVIEGWQGGELELAARVGLDSRVHSLMASLTAETEESHGILGAALCQAAAAGHANVLIAMSETVQLDAPYTRSRVTPAWVAAQNGRVQVLQFLRSAQCDLEKPRKGGATPAYIAAETGHVEVLKFLQSNQCDLEKPNTVGATPTWIAAASGHVEVLELLQSAQCDLEKHATDGTTPAWKAAQNGHVEVLKFLQSIQCDLEKPSIDGTTPACIAAQNGHVEVLKFLQGAKCDLEKASNRGATPAWNAAQTGHVEVLKLLQSAKCDLEKSRNEGTTPVWIAAASGHMEVLKLLQSAQCDLEKPANDGTTPAFIAAQKGHVEVLKLLQSAQCDLEKPANDGTTPACLAAQNGHLEVLKFLQGAKCGLEKPANDGTTPAWKAAQNGHVEVLKFLQSAQCDLEKLANDGITPAWIAAASGHVEVLKFLQSAQCDLEKPAKDGTTPACIAAQTGHVEVLKFLQSAQCDLKKSKNDGATPACTAACFGHTEVLKLLLSYKCDLEKPDNNGVTPAYLAAHNGHVEVLKLLQSIRCNLEKPTNDGVTPAAIAAQNGHVDALKLLQGAK